MKISSIYIFIGLLAPLLCLPQIQKEELNSNFDSLLYKANKYYNEAIYDSSIILFESLNNMDVSELNSEIYFGIKIKMIDSYLKKGDFFKAKQELLKTYQTIKDQHYSNPLITATLYYLDGEIKYKTGEFIQAKEIFTNSLNELNLLTDQTDSLKVLIYKGLGNIEFKSGTALKALKYYLTAKDIIELKPGDKPDPLLGSLYLNLALAYDKLKEIDSTDVYFMKSIEIKSEYSDDKTLLAASYSNYSSYLIKFGKTKKALDYLIRADSLYKEKYDDDYYKLAFLYLNFAKIYLLTNDYRQALNYFIKSENIYRNHLPKTDIYFESIKANMALLYKYMSKYEKSIETYNSEVLVNSANPATQIVRLRNIGECHLRLGNNDEAGKYFDDAINRSMAFFGANHIQTVTCYLSYSDYYSTINDIENAEICLKIALHFFMDYYGKNNREVTNVYNIYSINFLKIKAYEKAAKKAQLAIISITQGFSDTSIFVNPDFMQLQNDYHTIAALALKTKALGELMHQNPTGNQYSEKTLETALLGIRLFEIFKATLAEENSQLYNTEKINILFQYALLSAWQLYKNTGEIQFRNLAFQLSEKNKATILVSGMSQLAKGMNNHVPDSIIQKEQNIKQELRSFSSLTHEESKSPNRDSLKIIWLQNKIFDKRIELNTLMSFISNNYQKYYDLRNTQKVVSIKEVQANLKEYEVLLEYTLTEHFLFIFAIKQKETREVKIEMNPNFRKTVENYLAILRKPPPFDKDPRNIIQEYSDLSYTIYQTLIEPVEQFIENKELIIIPDDILGYLPFESLITSTYDVGLKNFRKLPYLIKEYPISYHYSSTLLLNHAKTKANWYSKKALVMAPIYRIDNNFGDSSLYNKLAFLKFTQKEAELVHKFIKGKLFMDSLASEKNFKKFAPDFSILHLAMHTLLDDENPLSSKLIFSHPTDSIEDGFLNTYEIYDLTLNAQLIVLSACETGSGKLRKGEGIMSMARGFLFAGAPSLLITHWKVNDASTANIMEGFYKQLESGKRKALQQSKLEYLANSNQIFSHPYYWSAYVVIGNDMPIGKQNTKFIYLIILVLVLLAISFFAIRRKT